MVNIFMTYFSIGLKLSPIQELLEELVHMPFCKLMTFFWGEFFQEVIP